MLVLVIVVELLKLVIIFVFIFFYIFGFYVVWLCVRVGNYGSCIFGVCFEFLIQFFGGCFVEGMKLFFCFFILNVGIYVCFFFKQRLCECLYKFYWVCLQLFIVYCIEIDSISSRIVVFECVVNIKLVLIVRNILQVLYCSVLYNVKRVWFEQLLYFLVLSYVDIGYWLVEMCGYQIICNFVFFGR